MTPTAQDTVIRLALASMAADKAGVLTLAQRTWVIERLHSIEALTPQERGKLQAPLLAWVQARQPRIYAIVAEQF